MDEAHRLTDELIEEMTGRIKEEYEQATKEVEKKLKKYLADFERKDAVMRADLEAGRISLTDYNNWRRGQIIVGRRWERLKNLLAKDMFNANMVAREMVYGYLPEIWGLNYNFAKYEIEKAFGADLGFTMYDRNAVAHILKRNPQLLPMPSPKRLREMKEAGEVLWEKQKIQSVALQAILQGESIPKIAKRITETLGEANYTAAVRNARTMATAAENGARVESYREAKAEGIEGYQEWMAVHDARTRHAHRQADGQKVGAGEPFDVDGHKMEYPGDPSAPGYLVYNCRCNVKFVPKGLTPRAERRREIAGYDSYEEWRAAKYDPKRDEEWRKARRAQNG